MTLKHFFEVYPPKRMWRKMWIGLADLPMMPQHRAKCLKMAGVNIKGRAMIYGGVGVVRSILTVSISEKVCVSPLAQRF